MKETSAVRENPQLRETSRPGAPKDSPTMRLHLWLETEEGLFFGIGRAQLLAKIDEHGSLKKAADELGMSYRAAWGKIRKTEEVLGVPVVRRTGNRRDGQELTEFGRELRDKFTFWFNVVEKQALTLAEEVFDWPVKGFEED